MTDVNNFLPIIDTWESYFHDPYEGLGTTYERVLLHDIFAAVDRHCGIESVLETPSFGMTGISGINSLWWGKAGREVFLIDDDERRLDYVKAVWAKLGLPFTPVLSDINHIPFEPDSVDLVWNFASLWFLQDLEDFAAQARQVSRKAILISVPNNRGLGFLLRRRYAKTVPQINLDHCRPRRVKQAFAAEGWRLQDEGIFDVPPWPDIPMKKEDLLAKLKLDFLLELLPKKAEPEAGETAESILDFFSGKRSEMDREIMKYSFLERTPRPFKAVWGHHRYFTFVKD